MEISSIAGDLTGDGEVGFEDFAILCQGRLQCSFDVQEPCLESPDPATWLLSDLSTIILARKR